MTKAPNHGTVNAAELTAYVELIANFFARYGRDPHNEEYAAVLANAKMLAAGDGPVSAIG